MSADKQMTDTPVTPEWIEQQCAIFESTLVAFTEEMRQHFRRKAEQGRGRWQRPEFAERMYQDLLAHAVANPLAAGEEAHCANFLAFLWRLRKENPGATPAVRPGPLPMLGGYGIKADRELVRILLEIIKKNIPAGDHRFVWLYSLDPDAALQEVNRAVAGI